VSVPHGLDRYLNHDRCRCDVCRTANRRAHKLRELRVIRGQPGPRDTTWTLGARRRCEALQLNGWSLREQGRLAGVPHLRDLIRHDRIEQRTHDSIDELYRRLWDKAAPRRTQRERQAYTRVVNRARALGFKPALAWDDIDSMYESGEEWVA
jgi:hypothetical protein